MSVRSFSSPRFDLSLRAGPCQLRGCCRVPSDKSMSQRAVLLAATATGRSVLWSPLDSADVRSVVGVVERLGAGFEEGDGFWALEGCGDGRLETRPGVLDFGNSGTGARLGLGLLSGLGVRARVCGDASLSARPMRRVLEPLRQMGAQFSDAETLPVELLAAGGGLRPFRGRLKIASAQVKSAILLAALRAEGESRLVELTPTRDHTERMLPAFGVEVRRDGDAVVLEGPTRWQAAELRIPADPSSAAPLAAAAALLPGSKVQFPEVLRSPRRSAFFEVLAAMGATVRWSDERQVGGETVAQLEVVGASLRGVELPPDRMADMIDELPLVAVLGAFAEGRTRVSGAAELRVKESDRIAAMVEGLRALGADIEEFPDGFEVRGRESLRGATLRSFADHRVAMALSVASLRATGWTLLQDAGCMAVSFPSFLEELQTLSSGALEIERSS